MLLADESHRKSNQKIIPSGDGVEQPVRRRSVERYGNQGNQGLSGKNNSKCWGCKKNGDKYIYIYIL